VGCGGAPPFEQGAKETPPKRSGAGPLTPTVVRPRLVDREVIPGGGSWPISCWKAARRDVRVVQRGRRGSEGDRADQGGWDLSLSVGASSGKIHEHRSTARFQQLQRLTQARRVWKAASPGTPRGRPNSKGTHRGRRGGRDRNGVFPD